MKKLIIIFLTISYCVRSQINWGVTLGSSNISGTCKIEKTLIDASDNVYVVGTFEGIVDFDPTATTFNLTSKGDKDIFLAKYNSNGSFIWSIPIGGVAMDLSNSINFDANGDIIIGGAVHGIVDYDPSSSTYTLTNNTYDDAVFLGRYNHNNGNFISVFKICKANVSGNIGPWILPSVRIDNFGNILVSGFFLGTSDFDPSSGTYNLVGPEGAYLAKYSNAGSFMWANKIAHWNNYFSGSINDIAIDNLNNIFVCGRFIGQCDFDPSATTYSLTSTKDASNSSTIDAFIAKYSSSGSFVFAKQLNSQGNSEEIKQIITNNNDLFICGKYDVSTDFDFSTSSSMLIPNNSSGNGFFAKYDLNCNIVFAKSLEGTSYVDATSICIYNTSNLAISGIFLGDVDLDPSSNPSIIQHSISAYADCFFAKYDQNANLLLAQKINISGSINSYNITNKGSDFYLSGMYSGTITTQNSLMSIGNNDGFTLKFNSDLGNAIGIEELTNASNKIKSYPNPTTGILALNSEQETSITITNIFGEIVLKQKLQEGKNTINLNDQANGVYFIKSNNSTFKIIKQ